MSVLCSRYHRLGSGPGNRRGCRTPVARRRRLPAIASNLLTSGRALPVLWSRPWNVRGSGAVSPGGRTDSALQSTLSGCPAGSVAGGGGGGNGSFCGGSCSVSCRDRGGRTQTPM